jgi:hypothetical protein
MQDIAPLRVDQAADHSPAADRALIRADRGLSATTSSFRDDFRRVCSA